VSNTFANMCGKFRKSQLDSTGKQTYLKEKQPMEMFMKEKCEEEHIYWYFDLVQSH
jgi:hypothetical protein